MSRILLALALIASLLSTWTPASAQQSCTINTKTVVTPAGPNTVNVMISSVQPIRALKFISEDNFEGANPYTESGLIQAGAWQVRVYSPNSWGLKLRRYVAGQEAFATFKLITSCGESEEFTIAREAAPWILRPHFSVTPTEANDLPNLTVEHATTFCIQECHRVNYTQVGPNSVKMESLDGQPFRIAIPWHANTVSDGRKYRLSKSFADTLVSGKGAACIFYQIPAAGWGPGGDHFEGNALSITLILEEVTDNSCNDRN